MTKQFSVVVVISLVYIAGIGALYVRGAGFLAAYLTMPAWLLIGQLSLVLGSIAPDSVLDVILFSWVANFVALIVSAALNVAVVYFVVRRFSTA